LKDYAALCRESGVTPRKVVLTFAPVSRMKTTTFVKWLGVKVPKETEEPILNAMKPVEESVTVLCSILKEILAECVGVGVPLGISCESVSIYKAEIDGVHELFRRLQGILLDPRGSPWRVQWVEVMPPANNEEQEETTLVVDRSGNTTMAVLYLLGVALEGLLVAAGVALGGKTRQTLGVP
jgi:hypothetical protein